MNEQQTAAMRQALEALESCTPGDYSTGHVIAPSYDEQAVEQSITALRQALEHRPGYRAVKTVHEGKPYYVSEQQPADEPLGYWNAVEGWVDLPEEKPVAWVEPEFWSYLERSNCGTAYRLPDGKRQPLYTRPQPAAWVGLTDDEIKYEDWRLSAEREYEAWTLNEQLVIVGADGFARAIEAKLKEKNGGKE